MRPLLWLLTILILLCGCGSSPRVTHQPLPQASNEIEKAVSVVAPARAEIQKAATEIKVTAKTADPAKAAPALASIDKQADVVIVNAAKIAEQEPVLALAAQAAAATEEQVPVLLASIDELQATVQEIKDEAKARDEAWARKITLGVITIASLAAGVGMWLGNTRLTIAAGLSGAIGVVLSILAGAVYAWRNAILIGVAVMVVVAAACMFVEWKKNGNIANVFRETDKPVALENR